LLFGTGGSCFQGVVAGLTNETSRHLCQFKF
jgi:hypothetical protein